MKAAALILAVVVIVLVFSCWGDERSPLVIDAAVSDECAPLPNPCDTTDCNRPNTKEWT